MGGKSYKINSAIIVFSCYQERRADTRQVSDVERWLQENIERDEEASIEKLKLWERFSSSMNPKEELRELKDTLRHRRSGSLEDTGRLLDLSFSNVTKEVESNDPDTDEKENEIEEEEQQIEDEDDTSGCKLDEESEPVNYEGDKKWKLSKNVNGKPAESQISRTYLLDQESKSHLENAGFVALDDAACSSPNTSQEDHSDSDPDIKPEVEEGFFEIDEIVGRRLSKDSMTYEYKVRFKGYGPEDDMWLPSSFFNRAVTFESTSKFGRKRKHTVDPNNAQEPPKKKKVKKKSSSNDNKLNDSKEDQIKMKVKKTATSKKYPKQATILDDSLDDKKPDEKAVLKDIMQPKHGVKMDTPPTTASKRKCNRQKTMTRKEKGRLYRQSFSTASQSKIPRKQHENEGTCPKPPTIHDDSSDDGTLEEEAVKADMVQPKHGVKMDTPPTTASKRKCNRQKTMTRKEKGRLYRQSLSTASQSKIPRKQHENEGTCPKPPTIHDDSSDDGTLEEEAVKADMVQPKHGVKMGNQVNAATILSSEDDVSSDDEELEDEGVLKDIKRRDDNFIHPRRIIAYTQFPDVDDTLSVYSTSNTIDGPITNALKVNRLPPYSTLEAAAEEFRRNNDSAFFIQFKSFGTFDRQGIRHLQRFHRLKQLRKEVEFEEKWLENAFENLGSNLKDAVTGALLDRWNPDGNFLSSYTNYVVTSQDLSLLCGERYLSDEIINLLLHKDCDKANEMEKSTKFLLLPSFLSTGMVSGDVIRRACDSVHIHEVKTIFLPVHMVPAHWGLLVISVSEKTPYFDDGIHCAITKELQNTVKKIITVIHDHYKLPEYDPVQWKGVQRLRHPIPSQPKDSGSCGIAVICAARDIINGATPYTWTFKDMKRLRATLMAEIVAMPQ
ncbi:hypothetical protein QZH41_007571 [Actinostola sp. cb2023]|nr:hypothetical protein QZH41_007571 [Actinostola sp. cb2023]